MAKDPSIRHLIDSHAADIRVRLYTPAHQGAGGGSSYFPDDIHAYDFPFLTRARSEAVEQRFSRLYGTKRTFFLTGGATQGLLAACMLVARGHRRMAIGLNSHLGVIHGSILAGMDPLFIPSRSWMPTAEEVLAALDARGSDIGAVLLTHPSYEGFTTDIGAVSDWCRARGILLIVDAAHGGHFPFFQKGLAPVSAREGDLVIHSLHKYVGGLVQTALLHLPEGSGIAPEQALHALSLFESTTRSNLLLLSIEDSVQRAFGTPGQALFTEAARQCDGLRSGLARFGRSLYCDPGVRDPLKIFLRSDRATGNEIGNLLLERGIDYEYSSHEGVLLIFSFRHTDEDFAYVSTALAEIQAMLAACEPRPHDGMNEATRRPIMQVSPRHAFFARKRELPIAQGRGMISAGCVNQVPPGIPILIPGEEVTGWHLQRLPPDLLIEVME